LIRHGSFVFGLSNAGDEGEKTTAVLHAAQLAPYCTQRNAQQHWLGALQQQTVLNMCMQRVGTSASTLSVAAFTNNSWACAHTHASCLGWREEQQRQLLAD